MPHGGMNGSRARTGQTSGQAKAAERKKQVQEARRREEQAEAERQGITVPQLRDLRAAAAAPFKAGSRTVVTIAGSLNSLDDPRRQVVKRAGVPEYAY
jgi:hypothetical protein